MNNILVFDTETNGKAKNFKAPMTDLNNWPRITQLAYQLYDRQGVLIKSFQSIIKPDGWTVPVEPFFIENNMSTERCEAEGILFTEVCDTFLEDFSSASILVAHNVPFDKNVLGAELMRYQLKPVQKKYAWICTMSESTQYCQLPGRYGDFKWPSLIELYTILFEKDFSGAHDAMVDVSACAESFFELVKRGVIVLPQEI